MTPRSAHPHPGFQPPPGHTLLLDLDLAYLSLVAAAGRYTCPECADRFAATHPDHSR